MVKTKLLFLFKVVPVGIALFFSVGLSGAGDNTDRSEKLEACARALFEKGMSTDRALLRRTFIFSGLCVGGLAIRAGYIYNSFCPSIRVLPSADMLPDTLSQYPSDILAISNLRSDPPLVEGEKFSLLEHFGILPGSPAMMNIQVTGMLPPMTEVPIILFAIAKNLREGKAVSKFKVLSDLSLIGRTTKLEEPFAKCLDRMKQPGYFLNNFPNESSATAAQDALQLYLSLVQPDPAAVLPTETFVNSSRADAFQLFLAAFGREWSKETRMRGKKDPFSSLTDSIAEILLPNSNRELFKAVSQKYRAAKIETFKMTITPIKEFARRHHKNIILFAPGWSYEDLIEALPQAKRSNH
jgi:hypothetical protein